MNYARILEAALLTRFTEEALLRLFAEGKANGTIHTCIGQELVGACLAPQQQTGDFVLSNHRGHGHYIAFTGDVEGLIAEVLGRSAGVCGGVGGSQQLCNAGFLSSGIQGGLAPVSLGLALGAKVRGSGNICFVFLGDGTLGEGSVYESLNLASKWSLPIVFVVEDNGIAQTTPSSVTLSGSVRGRAEAFCIPYFFGDTWNPENLSQVAEKAVAHCRSGAGPSLLHISTFRLRAHSKGDDTRDRKEVEPHEARDPLNILLANPSSAAAPLIKKTQARVDSAVNAALESPVTAAHPIPSDQGPLEWERSAGMPKTRFVQRLRDGFRELMRERQEILFLGQDVTGSYGGAFKASEGLSDEFPDRVFSTPISEAAIAGLATGLAIAGKRPLAEFMFGDFVALAFDQLLNHAAKLDQVYRAHLRVSAIYRAPMGGGRGYGPTHSQSLEKHLLGIPGLRVLALNHFVDPARIYRALLDSQSGPTFVAENKGLYAEHLYSDRDNGFRLFVSKDEFPVAWLDPASDSVDLTLVGFGGASLLLEKAADELFEKHDRICQVICPSQLHPFQIDPLLPLLRRSTRLLLVEEGQAFSGFSSEILAQLAERGELTRTDARRIGPAEGPIPASAAAEAAHLPSVSAIVQRGLEMCGPMS